MNEPTGEEFNILWFVRGPNPARLTAVMMALDGDEVDYENIECAADYCDEVIDQDG